MADDSLEAGSFRDRTSRVFYHAGVPYRGLTEPALRNWEMLSATTFFQRYTAQGTIVPTERVEAASVADLTTTSHWAAILKHQPIPFVSYPYEWCFSMLKDAALLQLELLNAALDEHMILKDASPFNIQWRGAMTVFIDLPSFESLTPGEPWIGYRQFCQLFLYPLFLVAYKDIPFQPWLRGSIDGIEPEHCYRLMSMRDLLRPGVFLHVYVQQRLQAQYGRTTTDIKKDLQAAGFNTTLIKANVQRLQALVQKLTWKPVSSHWSDYETSNTYTDTDREQKTAFVRTVVKSRPWQLVWDLGCNTGTFSRIAAENARYVVAMDADQLVIEHLYQALKREGNRTILPLVSNVVNPSPSLGWRGMERKALTARGVPDLTLCLALIHHVVIGANVPLTEFIGWLADLQTALIIEFVAREDPMVQTLLRNKKEPYEDYHTAHFERCLAEAFVVTRREVLASGTRFLYYGQARTQ